MRARRPRTPTHPLGRMARLKLARLQARERGGQPVSTAEQAREIVERRFGPETADTVIQGGRELPNGWRFSWQSRKYVETGDHTHALIGGSLYLVLSTGEVLEYDTAEI